MAILPYALLREYYHCCLFISAYFFVSSTFHGVLCMSVSWVYGYMWSVSPIVSLSSIDKCFSKFNKHKNHWTLYGFSSRNFDSAGWGCVCVCQILPFKQAAHWCGVAGPRVTLRVALPLRIPSTMLNTPPPLHASGHYPSLDLHHSSATWTTGFSSLSW